MDIIKDKDDKWDKDEDDDGLHVFGMFEDVNPVNIIAVFNELVKQVRSLRKRIEDLESKQTMPEEEKSEEDDEQ